MSEEAGGPEKRFLETFGNVVRWNGPFGVCTPFHQTDVGVSCSEFLLKRWVYLRRRTVCGLRILRPSITSSRNPDICTRSRTTVENGQHCWLVRASYGQRVGCQPCRVPPYSPNHPTGEIHKRHRRAMAPAFGLVEAKALLPYFMDAVTKARKLRFYLILEANSAP